MSMPNLPHALARPSVLAEALDRMAERAHCAGLYDQRKHYEAARDHVRAAARVRPPEDIQQGFFAAMLEPGPTHP